MYVKESKKIHYCIIFVKNRMCCSWKNFFLLLMHAGLHGLAAAEQCELKGEQVIFLCLSSSPPPLSPLLSFYNLFYQQPRKLLT